ncbi:MAG: methyltransferase domain-containing protein [Pseudomonadota bacterium]
MSFYQDDFYVNLHKRTLYPAKVILDIIFNIIPDVHSAIDVGCAVGSWLSVFKEKGIDDIQGIDGDWVNKDFLEIPIECFRSFDLTKPFKLDKKYDLAMSLEVAEHLPESSAKGFVSSLTTLSDFVLFSAAIPFQGGTNHVNEQWIEYWNILFKEQGFQGVDIVRRRIWNDAEIPFWYKQNLILFVRKERICELQLNADLENYNPIALVHPEQYLSAKVALRIVLNSIKQKVKKNF